jgi:hypothetical protein
MIKIKSLNVQFVGIPVFATKQAAANWANAWAIAKVAGGAPPLLIKCCGRVARL